jgi:two-component system, chemotaxis family, CheB/CheR fusion protein
VSSYADWRILIVEDEYDGQVVVTQMLKLFRIESDSVGTAEEALNALERMPYAGVVVDLNLPEMDGIELVERLRADPDYRNLPCVAITAYHTSAVKAQALQAGFDAYFSKPLDDTAFMRELERVIQARQG